MVRSECEEGHAHRCRRACRSLRHHRVVHPQRAVRRRCASPPRPQRRVQAAMHDLDYRPNRSARNLRRSSTQTIGRDLGLRRQRYFASQMLTGASAAARRCDHLLVIGETEGDPRGGGAADRGDGGPAGRRHRLRHARRLPGHASPRRCAARARGAAELRRPGASTCPRCCPTTRSAGGRRPSTCSPPGSPRPVYVVGEDPTPEATAGRDRLPGDHGGPGRGRDVAGRRRAVPVGRRAGVRRGGRLAGHRCATRAR